MQYNLGFKIFLDNKQDLINDITEKCYKENLPIEINFFNYNMSPVLESDLHKISNSKFSLIKQKIMHFDYNNILGFKILMQQVRSNMNNEILLAKKFGINEGVLHYHHVELPEYQAQIGPVIQNLWIINDVSSINNFYTYIENTAFENRPANISFYRDMFEYIIKNKLNNIGFCFDIGHGKCFSTNTLKEWFEFLLWLQSNGIKLHFHLHNNDGNGDNHYSYMQADKLGLNIGDAYSNHIPYIQIVKYICETFSGKKTLENAAEISIPSYDWLKNNLDKL